MALVDLDKALDDRLGRVGPVVIASWSLELDDDDGAAGVVSFLRADGTVIEEREDVRFLR